MKSSEGQSDVEYNEEDKYSDEASPVQEGIFRPDKHEEEMSLGDRLQRLSHSAGPSRRKRRLVGLGENELSTADKKAPSRRLEKGDGTATEGSSSAKPTSRANKNRPQEVSSSRAVGRFREVVVSKREKSRDPRFEGGGKSSKLNYDIFRKAYGFLEDYQDNEIEELKKSLKKEKDQERSARLNSLLTRLQQERVERARGDRTREALRQAKKKERRAVADGKNPYYLKNSDKKILSLEQRYEGLKEEGKLGKFMEKKRKRNAAKDHRWLPAKRQDKGIAPNSLTVLPRYTSAARGLCQAKKQLLTVRHSTATQVMTMTKGLAFEADDEAHDNRVAYQRFFAAVVDSTDRLDRLLDLIDTPSREDELSHPRRASFTDDDAATYDSVTEENTLQFNNWTEASKMKAMVNTLRQLDVALASEGGIINLRAIAFWCLAKRERLWADSEELALLEQTSLRNFRAMQVNHQEVDMVLHDRVKHILERMRRLQLEISSKSDEWTKVLLGAKDKLLRVRENSYTRAQDNLEIVEERIAVLKHKLAESEHHDVGLSNASADFQLAENKCKRRGEHLQHIVQQQHIRLEQTYLELRGAEDEARALDDSLATIIRLESAAAGGVKSGGAAYTKQLAGKEQLQALVREEDRRHLEKQRQAAARRAGLLEENKHLRTEVAKAESGIVGFSSQTSDEDMTNSRLRLHKGEVETLEVAIKNATEKLVETERHFRKISSRTKGRDREASLPFDEASPHHDANHPNLDSSIGNISRRGQGCQTARDLKHSTGKEVAAEDGSSELSRKIEMLREEQRVLLEDLENITTEPRDDPIREHSLLRAACFQLCNVQRSNVDAENKREAYSAEQVALELAAIAVSIELPSSSGLPQEGECWSPEAELCFYLDSIHSPE